MDNRCHVGHASSPSGSGGRDGVAPNSTPVCASPWGLPFKTGQQIHLEKGVSGCHGEVSLRESKWT